MTDQSYILVTRPEPGASETAARLRALGLTPLLAPVLQVEAVPARLPPPGSMAAVLVTSANAIPAFGPTWFDRPLLGVGAATARRAVAAGFRNVISADGDAVALASLVQRRFRPADGPLLLASGRGQGMALSASLRAAGFRVLRRVVYAARPAASLPDAAVQALAAGRVASVLFFSADTARGFVRLIRRAGLADALRASEAVAIGRPAGMALQALAWRRICVAAKPNQEEMLALLQ